MDQLSSTHQPERIKIAMVIYAIERSLARLIQISLPDERLGRTGVFKELKSRASDGGSTTAGILEETYLGDLIKLTRECVNDFAASDALKEFLDRTTALEIVAIRNIACHPNRPLADFCWHRIAAIASDPTVTRLGFDGVREAFQSAQEGTLTPPPEKWYYSEVSTVPNNIPRNSDFRITGLVGRNKELQKFQNWVVGGRWRNLAIVAPGGVGKTALVLELLETLSNGEVSPCPFDAILYSTLKQEKLTEAGIVKLTNSDSLESLDREIAAELIKLSKSESFAGDPGEIGESKVLLCIDNAETLAFKDPKIFVDWVDNLSPRWTVVITSRVPVDGFRHDQLQGFSETTSESLAYIYSNARGISGIKTDDIKKIAKNSSGNPLAIKLMVDMLARGAAMSASIQTSSNKVVEFSYRNFVSILGLKEVQILELMFSVGSVSRSLIGTVLDMSAEETASYLAKLLQTSIVIREEVLGTEQFSLDSNVRELIRIDERHLENRRQVQQKLAQHHKAVRFHILQQGEHELEPHDLDYIDPQVKEDLQSHLVEGLRAIKSQSDRWVVNSLKNFQQVRDFYENSADYHYIHGRLFAYIGDVDSAIHEFSCAIDANPLDPRYLNFKAEQHRHKATSESLEEALELFGHANKIMQGKECYLAKRCCHNYFDLLVELRRHQEILNETEDWKRKGPYYFFLGLYRAHGFILSVAAIHGNDPHKAHSSLCEASNLISSVFRVDGSTFHLVDCMGGLIYELAHLYERNPYLSFSEDERFSLGSTFMRIMDDAFSHMDVPLPIRKATRRIIEIGRKMKFEAVYNPYKNTDLRHLGAFGLRPAEQIEAEKRGLGLAVITNSSTSSKGYVFARKFDSDISNLFVHQDSFVTNPFPAWLSAYPGDVIAYIESEIEENGYGGYRVKIAYSRKDFENDGEPQNG